ncbi:hypothetical protein [Macrococcus brunensis]|uniref:hypothetical protein n=1 Tax=Macrococcus brunensis TaxID=198483 RepID=UPI001EF0CA53|nr:hypothetical protein [Macrococcus brunensis]ULG70886.1 hypothetical protein MGG12_05845 [Macrococcus brunensis]
MNRNYEKELGLTQQKLQEALAREVMLTAMLDDKNNECEQLKQQLNDNQEAAEKEATENLL